MQQSNPVILIVTTQVWLQVTRMAVRFTQHGCRVSALCPANHDLRFFERLHTCHTFQPVDPLFSLEAAIQGSGADYLVPGDDRAVWLLHELYLRAPGYKRLIERSLGRGDAHATVRSRFGLLALASRLGIAVPETVLAPTIEDARAFGRKRDLPFVLKKDGTFAGGGVEIVSDPGKLPHHYDRLNREPSRWEPVKQRLLPVRPECVPPDPRIQGAEISAQAFVEGAAANAMFACDQGGILATVQARVIAAKSKTGPAVMIDLLNDARIERAGALLASSLGLSGFFGLDFILEKETGVPYLIEMNPRCTQMGHIAVANQSDLAGVLWARWSGRSLPTGSPRALTASIYFYPHSSQWLNGSSFLERARPDVCAEDREIVDRLAQGNPARLARCYRAVRAQLKLLKHSLAPPAPMSIHYFEPAASPGAAQTAYTPGYAMARSTASSSSVRLGAPASSVGGRLTQGGPLNAPPRRA